MLHKKVWGKGGPVVLLHGFTQSSRAWGPIAGRLSAGHEVSAVDLPGHGKSAGVAAGLWGGAWLVARDARQPAAVVGYSLGGRFALHLALAHTHLVRRLVLVSATAGMADGEERAARRASDERLAQRVEREGVEAFVTWWLSQPMWATLPAGAAAVESRLGGTAAGLAGSLRLAGAGSQEPLWHRLGALTMPVLVVAGELDRPYVQRAERLVDGIGPSARLAVIPGAGHACHLEAPAAWLAAVEPFLAGEG